MSDYAITHQGRVFTPDRGDVAIADVATHNQQVEQQEIATWRQVPDRWHGYVTLRPRFEGDGDRRAGRTERYVPIEVTTFLGTVIGRGTVTGVARGFYGARVLRIRMIGTNGGIYIGAYGPDGGNLVRLRRTGPLSYVHTSCRHCGQDIEGLPGQGVHQEWRDRGNNPTCPTPAGDAGQRHEPIVESIANGGIRG